MTTLPTAPVDYDPHEQQVMRGLIEEALRNAFRTGVPSELGADTSIIWTDSNGARWEVTIDPTGALVSAAL